MVYWGSPGDSRQPGPVCVGFHHLRIQLLRRLTRGGGQKYLFQAFMASSHFRRTWWIVIVSYVGLLYIAYSPPIRGTKLPKLIWHPCTARSDLGLYPAF